MRKLLLTFSFLFAAIGAARAQQTIDQLGHAAVLTGAERLPMFQSVNPAVYGLTTDIATYMWNSPQLTGTPIAPEPLLSDNSFLVATTNWVKGQNYLAGSGSIVANRLVIGLSANSLTALAAGTATTVLHGGTPPTFSAVNLASGGDTTGILPFVSGGFGIGTATANAIPYFPTTSTVASSGALTNGQPIIMTAGVPVSGAVSGNTTTFATASGTLTTGDCVSINAGNFVDAGGPCTTGGGGGTVSAGSTGQSTGYFSNGTTVAGNPNLTFSSGSVTFGQAGSVIGKLILAGNTSSNFTLAPSPAAGGWIMTEPNTAGLSGQFQQTDGSGNMSWQSIASDLTAGTANLSITGTTNATISQSAVTNAQAGASYNPFVATDKTKYVTRTNGSAQTDTLPQATGSFATGWYTTVYTTAAQDTITPTTSTINGASTLVMGTKQGAFIWADGTGSYSALLSLPQPVASAVFTANSSGIPLWTAGSATNVVHGDGSIANIANASLQNASTTVAGQICTLGASCAIAVTNLSNVGGGTIIANTGASSAPPNATTHPVLGIVGTSTGAIDLNGSTSGTVTLTAQNTAGTAVTFALPNTNGTNGQFLQTNGSGVASWQNATGTGTVNSGSQYQLGYYATAGTAISGSAGITTNVNANLVFTSGMIGNLRTVSDANVTFAATDYEVDMITLTAARTFQLPACAAGNQGQQFIMKDEANKAFFFNLTGSVASSGTIEGATNAIINSNGASLTFSCEGNGNYATI